MTQVLKAVPFHQSAAGCLSLLAEQVRRGVESFFLTQRGVVVSFLHELLVEAHGQLKRDHLVDPDQPGGFAGLQREEFVALWLDTQNRLIGSETLSTGTLTQASVYPREVARSALFANARSVIFAHNHPSGTAEPSRADEFLTQTLRSALGLVDVRFLDHFVVAGDQVVSFAERGLV